MEQKILRIRFLANGDDYRPIKWPVKHPYWRTGSTSRMNGVGEEVDWSVVVAYAESEAEILELWPEALELDVEERDCYTFTSRFRRPEWFVNTGALPEQYPDTSYPSP